MTKSKEKAIRDDARGYIRRGEDYSLWEAELGWEDWMIEFCTEEEAKAEDSFISEKSVNSINDFLKKIWEEEEEAENNK